MDSLHNLGGDYSGWSPAFQDYKLLLEQLKSPDEMLVYEAVMTLQNQLSIAQENTLSNFAVDQFLASLLEILKRPQMSDFSNEINMFAIQCLTNLMDIFPNICNNIVTQGGVKCFAQVLERSMGFIDLNEACIKAIEKISNENPYAILTSGSMALVLNMLDFFEISTQKRIIAILLNISRHSASEVDLNQHLLPMLPCLCMFLHSRGGQDSVYKIESVSTIILRITESIFRFISPNNQIEKLAQQMEMLGQTGILDAMLSALQDYCVFENTIRASPDSSQQQKIMSIVTIQNFLRILGLFGSFSINLTRQILDFNILKLLEIFLPSQEDQKKQNFNLDQYPYIQESISLIDSLLPQREDPHVENISEPSKQRARFESERRNLYQEQKMQQMIFYTAGKLLPRIFNVHENNFSQGIRVKTLQAIDKLILLFSDELLNNFIEPYSFAKFINTNLRSNQLQSILQCLQMVDKLMKSNPKNYTLPLIREGITQFIKGINTLEDLEKLTGSQLIQAQEVESVDRHEEMLQQAKNVLIRGPQPGEGGQEGRLFFEQTIQKYMELARMSSSQNPGTPLQTRQTVKQGKAIIALSDTLRNQYFENQDFIQKINEQCGGEDLQVMEKLKALANDIIEEGKQEVFEFQRNVTLMKRLKDALTKSQRSMMNYELKESGLLEALKLYLTMTSQQIQLHCQINKAGNKEEVKRSEELQMQDMQKNAAKVTKKQARCFIQRLKVFLHIILNKSESGKQPIVELVNICHEFLSQSENLIFDQNSGPQHFDNSVGYGGIISQQYNDPNQSMMALRQLTRRLRVNLVYDPQRTTIKRDVAMSGVDQMSQPNESMLAPPSLQKAVSHTPAFMQLADQTELENQSKVFARRHFLYNELKQVLVSVEQCASLFLLEDFLRNRIKTVDDVKNLKVPPSLYQQAKATSSSAQLSRQGRDLVSSFLERMRDLLEVSGTRESFRQEAEDFTTYLLDELLSTSSLTEGDHIDILRQLEVHSLQVMDDFYADHQGEEEAEERLLTETALEEAGYNNITIEEKMREFQRTISRLREEYRNRKAQYSAEELSASKKKTPPKKEINEDADMKDEDGSGSGSKNEEEEKKSSSRRPNDVDMTDEEEEETARRRMDELRDRLLARQQDIEGVMLNTPEKQDKEKISDDLEQLIKANGDDIEFEFYIGGEPVPPNQTIYEIMRKIESKSKKSPSPSLAKDALNSILQMLQGSSSGADQLTVHFAIRDKHENIQKSRKDSVMEWSQKRDRTKSEAVNEISASTVNELVQQLIEKEFQVIGKEFLDQNNSQDKHFNEKVQLENSLKILKVLNFLIKNINLFTGTGIKFLINHQVITEEELKEDGFQDLDLQFGVSQLQANLFHHHKLDSYILKNIQDPYNLISGAVSENLTSIFRNCPFLFPFQTRLLFFKLISFIGSIDMNRSIFFLRQFLKQKLGQLPQEDKHAVKIQRQKVIVERTKILECSFSLMSKVSNRAFLEVEYRDEKGTGLGPTLEFYYLVAQEIKGYKTPQGSKPAWRQMPDNTLFPSAINVLQINNEELQKVYELFRLAGMMIAKSISDDRLIDLPISPLFWDLVLGKKMNIFDLERLEPDFYKVFSDLQLLANKKKDLDKTIFQDQEHRDRALATLKTKSGVFVEDLCLTFTVPGFDDIELKPEGKSTEVTLSNLQEYIDLVMHFLFHETVKIQIQAFKKGFNQIFPVESLRPFSSSSSELEDMICGTQRNEEEWTSLQKLSEFFVPAHGYHHKSQSYLHLLRFITELNLDGRRQFLLFMTGSPRLPNGGFGAMDPKFTVVLKKPVSPAGLIMSQEMLNSAKYIDEILPSVMTCQNYIKLPAYSSYEVLKAKLEQAYTQGQNNFSLT